MDQRRWRWWNIATCIMALDEPIVVMTVKEVADYLKVHPSTIYKLLRQNLVPAFQDRL